MSQLSTLMASRDTITVDNDTHGDEIGAAIPGPPGPGIRDPEIVCDRMVGATDGGRRDDESSVDGAGQHDRAWSVQIVNFLPSRYCRNSFVKCTIASNSFRVMQ